MGYIVVSRVPWMLVVELEARKSDVSASWSRFKIGLKKLSQLGSTLKYCWNPDIKWQIYIALQIYTLVDVLFTVCRWWSTIFKQIIYNCTIQPQINRILCNVTNLQNHLMVVRAGDSLDFEPYIVKSFNNVVCCTKSLRAITKRLRKQSRRGPFSKSARF